MWLFFYRQHFGRSIKMMSSCKWPTCIISLYYINTNEIPGELSCENLTSSHVKITCYLHKWKYHCCYGYIINRTFHTKKLLKWNGLVLHLCLYNKKIEHYTAAWRYEISLLVLKNISLVCCTHLWNIFQHSKRNFVSPRGHVMSSIILSFKPMELFTTCAGCFPVSWTSRAAPISVWVTNSVDRALGKPVLTPPSLIASMTRPTKPSPHPLTDKRAFE